MNSHKRIFSLLLLGLTVQATSVFAQGKRAGQLGVITYNVDEGTDYIEALTANSLILTRGELAAENASVFGGNPEDRTPGGLWPSDHLGVAATFNREAGHED